MGNAAAGKGLPAVANKVSLGAPQTLRASSAPSQARASSGPVGAGVFGSGVVQAAAAERTRDVLAETCDPVLSLDICDEVYAKKF